MKLITKNGNGFIFSEKHGHAVYYENPGNFPGKILKVVTHAARECEWAKANWGGEPQPLTTAEETLLERTAPFRRKIENLAIKNSKGESWVLQQSAFFITSDGRLLTRGSGHTSRRVHQGGNSWELYNLEAIPCLAKSTSSGESVDFGTYGGEPTPWGGLRTGDLTPISQKEWEELTNRPFSVQTEFGWFKGSNSWAKSRGIIKSGGYIFRHTFPAHSEMGRYAIYPERDTRWSDDLNRGGEEEPISVSEVTDGFGNPIFMGFDSEKGVTAYFGKFKLLNLPAVWAGFEGTLSQENNGLGEAIYNLHQKAADRLSVLINWKLRRELTVDQVRDVLFFEEERATLLSDQDHKKLGLSVPIRQGNLPMYTLKNFPADVFRGKYLINFWGDPDGWVDECRDAVGKIHVCFAHGNGDHSVPTQSVKEILDCSCERDIFVSSIEDIEKMS